MDTQSSNTLRCLVSRHPYIAGLTLTATILLIGELIGLFVFGPLHLPYGLSSLLNETVLMALIVIPILLLGWWKETGFTSGLNKHTPVVCLGAILLIGLPILCTMLVPATIYKHVTPFAIIYAIVLSILVGIFEEGLMRGLLLRLLLPKGILTSVILTSIIFAGIHLTNLFSGLPFAYVINQIIGALGIGLLFAAIRLRSGSIWPTVALHALHDIPGLIVLVSDPQSILSTQLTRGTLIFNSVYSFLFIINAIILLRPSKLRQLQIAYGLAQPLPPTYHYPFPTYYPPNSSQHLYTSPEFYLPYPPPTPDQAYPPPPPYHPPTNEPQPQE